MAKRIPSINNAFFGLEKRYERSLSEAERVEIGTNLKGFFGLLHQWTQEDAQKEATKGERVNAQEKSLDG